MRLMPLHAGRARGVDDMIAYHLRQSFVPGKITPEEAKRHGKSYNKYIERPLKGKS